MTNKPIPATCDAGCGKQFKLTKFKSRIVKGGNEKLYFLCPHCKHEYIAYYSSKETNRLQAQMRKLHVSMRGKSGEEMASLVNIESSIKAMIKQSMDEARAVSES